MAGEHEIGVFEMTFYNDYDTIRSLNERSLDPPRETECLCGDCPKCGNRILENGCGCVQKWKACGCWICELCGGVLDGPEAGACGPCLKRVSNF